MTKAQEAQLDAGILPENMENLTPEQYRRWIQGMHASRRSQEEKERKEFRCLLDYLGLRYVKRPDVSQEAVETAIEHLCIWCEEQRWFQREMFFTTPDFTVFAPLFQEPILAYHAQNQGSGHWGNAEYAMVAKHPMAGGHLNFHFIEGSYNVSLGDPVPVELEEGARRRVWAWRLTRRSLQPLQEYLMKNQSAKKPGNMDSDLNRALLQDFAAGQFTKSHE